MSKTLTFETWDDEKVNMLITECSDFMGVLKWAFREYGDKLVYACSFGAEGIVLLDLISKVTSQAKVIFLDTDLHFKETYQLIDKIKSKYPNLQIDLVQPSLTLNQQKELHGDKLWESNPNLCCQIRKIEPLTDQLSGVHAWISGLRREQSPTRKNIQFINKDSRFKRVKICPLIQWTWKDVWEYIKLNNLPYNELHDRNYPSIGCEKCTLPSDDPSDSRSGRWANNDKTECGLHNG
ncbi:phosphoadenylyl-sulfate reductase [Mesobacillus harenae]|uniref:phosphoadenylyl-sulfate reductase n=1 Tax=Mesobacillus harenae TaxID=2213203 RepID=UPI001580901B|nr:phosphoadenylyl-sulfate reductase [Mesobacillus harenae]